jgi:hypothetical protein
MFCQRYSIYVCDFCRIDDRIKMQQLDCVSTRKAKILALFFVCKCDCVTNTIVMSFVENAGEIFINVAGEQDRLIACVLYPAARLYCRMKTC